MIIRIPSIYSRLLLIPLFFIVQAGRAQIVDSIPPHESFTIFSEHLGENRPINIWIPPNYDKQTDSLQVLYMLDGGIQEDFPHIANTLQKLIEEKVISPMLLVGIENTQRRRDLTGFTENKRDKSIAPVVGGSEKFKAFLNDELFSEIARRYRVNRERSLMGESLAGLFVVETLLTSPDMFDNYIAFDPSLWWNNHFLVRNANNLLRKLPTSEKSLWFASSGTKDIYQYTNQLEKTLQKTNPLQLKWKYIHWPKETHSTIFRATKIEALLWVFKTKSIR